MVKVGKYESRRLRSRKPGYNSDNGFGFFFFFFFLRAYRFILIYYINFPLLVKKRFLESFI